MQKRLKCREAAQYRMGAWALLMVFALGAVVGCAHKPPAATTQPAPEVVAAPAPEAPPPRPSRRAVRDATIVSLLAQADDALAEERLTTPVHDNAYDSFAGVLLLDPGNEDALAGLQAILLRYTQLARAAIRNGRLVEAEQLIARARTYYPQHPLLQEVGGELAQAREATQHQLRRISQADLVGDEFPLPAQELARKSEAVRKLLSGIGERVRESRESVLIVARTDAEARWIYKQINDAAQGFRVRGDVRLGSTPKLQLMPPL